MYHGIISREVLPLDKIHNAAEGIKYPINAPMVHWNIIDTDGCEEIAEDEEQVAEENSLCSVAA